MISALVVDGDSGNRLSAVGLIYRMKLRNDAACIRLKAVFRVVASTTVRSSVIQSVLLQSVSLGSP